jgi:hypothetical protein
MDQDLEGGAVVERSRKLVRIPERSRCQPRGYVFLRYSVTASLLKFVAGVEFYSPAALAASCSLSRSYSRVLPTSAASTLASAARVTWMVFMPITRTSKRISWPLLLTFATTRRRPLLSVAARLDVAPGAFACYVLRIIARSWRKRSAQ